MKNFTVDNLVANSVTINGEPVNVSSRNIETKLTLPAPSLVWFEKQVFIIGDGAYICTSNVEVPVIDAECFWVQA